MNPVVRKSAYGLIGMTMLIGTLVLLSGTKEASSQVQFNINIGPPPVVSAEPPEVVFIPGTAIYFVPNLQFDVFFCDGWWWSPRGVRWYRSASYEGPWKVVNKRYVPAAVSRVPKNYRSLYKHEKHVPYGQLKKHGQKSDTKRKGSKGSKEDSKHGRGHGRGDD